MNSKILLLAVTVAALSSCTTSYKTGQTPDDVYYSPTRPQEEYVQRDNKDDDRRYRNNDDDYYEDQYLRMKVRNRYRWSDLDDPFNNRYNYSIYNNGYGCFSNPWTPATYWNNHYNPYYQGTVIINPQTTTTRYSGPRTFNLNSYNNTALTNGNYTNPKATGPGSGSSNNNYNNTYNAPRNSSSNNGSNSGNILRNVFNSNNSNNSPGNSSTNNSSSTSSPSSSGSSSSSSGSSAPVRRF